MKTPEHMMEADDRLLNQTAKHKCPAQSLWLAQQSGLESPVSVAYQ